MIPYPSHLLWNAIDVKAPPSGFTAAAGNGSTDDAPALQAIFDAIPINGSRTVFFPASTDYKIGGTVQVKTDDTLIVVEHMQQLISPTAGMSTGIPMILFAKTTAGQAIERVTWIGGRFEDSGGHSRSAFRIDHGRFCTVEHARSRFTASVVEIGAAGSGEISEFCGTIAANYQGSATSGTVEEIHRFGSFFAGTHSTSSVTHRNCFAIMPGCFGTSPRHVWGTSWSRGEDGLIEGGDMDTCAEAHHIRSTMVRMHMSGAYFENCNAGHVAESGSTGFRSGWSTVPVSGWVALGTAT